MVISHSVEGFTAEQARRDYGRGQVRPVCSLLPEILRTLLKQDYTQDGCLDGYNAACKVPRVRARSFGV